MAIDRRRLLLGGLALAALAAGPARAGAVPLRYAAATCPEDGTAELVALTDAGRVEARLPLPTRAHGLAWHSGRRLGAVFARRPGAWVLLFDASMRSQGRLEAAAGRHFYGHGCFSADGRLLYASENDYEAARGVVGVYDLDDRLRRLGELDGGGVGPHEVMLLPDGETLAVANGGIETHPDYGRQKLNLRTMRPSVTLLDRRSGRLLQRHEPPERLHQLSLRHLAAGAGGGIWFAAQYEGPLYEAPPLAGWLTEGGGLAFAEAPPEGWRDSGGYGAAIAAWRDRVAVSLPRGDRLFVWSAAEGRFLAGPGLNRPFALAPGGGRLLVGGLEGEIWHLGDAGVAPDRHRSERWDNHAVALL